MDERRNAREMCRAGRMRDVYFVPLRKMVWGKRMPDIQPPLEMRRSDTQYTRPFSSLSHGYMRNLPML